MKKWEEKGMEGGAETEEGDGQGRRSVPANKIYDYTPA